MDEGLADIISPQYLSWDQLWVSGVAVFSGNADIPAGRSGNLSLIFCSATVAASVRIFWASSFAFSKLIVRPVLCPASIIIPLSRFPICPSSLSASGNMLAIPVLTVRSTPTAGASVETTSPSSDTVLSLRTICSSAKRACMIIFSIFRTSASSLANTLALGISCLL